MKKLNEKSNKKKGKEILCKIKRLKKKKKKIQTKGKHGPNKFYHNTQTHLMEEKLRE